MTDRLPSALVILGGLVVTASAFGDWQSDDLGAIGIDINIVPIALGLSLLLVLIGLSRLSAGVDDRLFAGLVAIVTLAVWLVGGVGYAEVIGTDLGGLAEIEALLAPMGVIVGGVLALIGALTSWFAVETQLARRKARATGLMVLVGFGGLLAMFVWAQVLLVPMVAFAGTADLPMWQLLVASNVSLGLGMATAAVAYLLLTDRDWSFIDLKIPSLKDLGWTVVGIGGLLGALIAVGILLELLGAPSAEHGLVEDIMEEGDPELLLFILIPTSLLIIGPGEELLFRNIIQKSLYNHFSRPAAIVVTSLVFALAHIPAYWAGADTVTAVIVISVLSLLLGAIYAKTENIVVPALVHGAYNAILFAGLYVEMTMDTDAMAVVTTAVFG